MKNIRLQFGVVAAAATLTIASSAFAHHSFALFDGTKLVDVQGTVREYQWTNPHCWVDLLVDEDGQQVAYPVEGGSVSVMRSQGWARDSVNAGDKVTITVHPLKSGERGGSLVKAVLANGKTIGHS